MRRVWAGAVLLWPGVPPGQCPAPVPPRERCRDSPRRVRLPAGLGAGPLCLGHGGWGLGSRLGTRRTPLCSGTPPAGGSGVAPGRQGRELGVNTSIRSVWEVLKCRFGAAQPALPPPRLFCSPGSAWVVSVCSASRACATHLLRLQELQVQLSALPTSRASL